MPIKLFKSASIAGSESLAAGTIPSFDRGTASASSKMITGDAVQNLINITELNPTLIASIQVKEDKPIVALNISNIVIKQINKRPKDAFSTFEADVLYEFDVQWQANLAAPQFTLDCIGGNNSEISTTAGRQHVNAKGLLILYPGVEQAHCYANHGGNTWGSASISFLVGDADSATKRAIQVVTDIASFHATLTAAAVGTARVEQTLTAIAKATQTVAASQTAQSIATSNAVGTEVAASKTAEFRLTANAAETARARPTDTPKPPTATPTFAPKLVESFGMRGDTFSVSGKVPLTPRRLWRICISGTAFLINPDRAVGPEILHVNGISVPRSGCIVVEGTGAVVVITCTQGLQPAKDPGGYQITVEDLGPS
ncbi:MAG: hypothetical protein HY070_00615 [Chloroflexi bacterium]|nr:hypothetical protein [Chloroflexota bacterium]